MKTCDHDTIITDDEGLRYCADCGEHDTTQFEDPLQDADWWWDAQRETYDLLDALAPTWMNR